MVGAGERIEAEAPSLVGDDAARDTAVGALEALDHVRGASFDDGTLTVVCEPGEHNLIDVLQALRALDVPVGHVTSRTPTLNDVFLALTGTQLRDS